MHVKHWLSGGMKTGSLTGIFTEEMKMNAPAIASQNHMPAMAMNEQDLIITLRNSLYPGAADNSIKMVLSYCRAAGLDPMTKPVHIVPMWDSKAKQMRDVVMPGIELYRTKAARSGAYAGVTEPEFGPTVTGKVGGVEISYPEWCRVTVKRLLEGNLIEFTAKEYWLENYATAGKDTQAPNAMWKKRPFAQLAKCAEAQALRKGFPEVGAQPTADEMMGKAIDGSFEVIPDGGDSQQSGVRQPQRKSEAKQQTAETGDLATDGQLRMIRAKLEHAGLAEEQLFKQFEIESMESIQKTQVNEVLAWITEMVEAANV